MKTDIMSFFEKTWNIVMPSKIRKRERYFLSKIGLYQINDAFYGLIFFIEALISLFLCVLILREFGFAIAWMVISPFVFALIFLAMLFISFLFYITYIEVKIYNRIRQMEEHLPMFLEALSINLKSGLNLNKALVNSTSPEFGTLHNEMMHVIKESETGKSLEDALLSFVHKYKSPLLSEVFELIVTSYREGGKTSLLTEMMITNINNSNYLKKKVIASVMSYVIFISLVSLVLAPMLFSLSFNLLVLTQSLITKLLIAGKVEFLPQFISGVSIKSEDFILFSRIAVVIIALASASIIAIIQKNSIKAGIKYLILFVIVSSASYQFFLWTSTMLFKSIFSSIML